MRANHHLPLGQKEEEKQRESAVLLGLQSSLQGEKQPLGLQPGELYEALSHFLEGIVRVDDAGRCISLNEAFRQLIGPGTCARLLGGDWKSFFMTDDWPKLEEAYRVLLQTGKAEVEARSLRSDGRIFQAHVLLLKSDTLAQSSLPCSALPVVPEQKSSAAQAQALCGANAVTGTPWQGHLCFVKDVTARRIAETKLALQHDVAMLFATHADPMLIVEDLLAMVCQSLEFDLAALWLFNGTGNRLRCAGLWQKWGAAPLDALARTGYPQPDPCQSVRAVNNVTAIEPPGDSRGESGHKAEFFVSGMQINLELSLENELHSSVWQQQRASAALGAGLRFANILPFHCEGRVGGVLEFYSRHKPVCDFTNTLQTIANLWGLSLQRAKAEAALMGEQRQLRDIVSAAPVAMAMLDAKLRYVTHSRLWAAQENLTPGAIIGKGIFELSPELHGHWNGIFTRALLGEELSKPEDTIVRKDGTAESVRWAVHPWRTPQGELGGIIIVKHSIQELVKARESALESVRLKSEFLANMSHEIRTPLHGILGVAEVLAQEQDLNESQRAKLGIISDSGRALLNIINDILDFSKIEADKLDLESKAFSVRELVSRQVGLLAPEIHKKGLQLRTQLDPQLPTQLQGDPGRIGQVLLNLLGNALKFTPAGEVSVEVKVLEPSPGTADTELWVQFRVSDTGIGLEESQLGKLFAPFFQADGSTARRFGGTGLGLSICKKLVDRMGGFVHAESPGIGQGASFYFALPLLFQAQPQKKDAVQNAAAAVPQSASPFTHVNSPHSALGRSSGSSVPHDALHDAKPAGPGKINPPSDIHTLAVPSEWPLVSGGRRECILVAEDNPVNRILIAQQLTLLGYSSQVVEDGLEALALLDEGEEFLCLILDCQMPHLDGYETARAIRARERRKLQRSARLPIVALTASAMKGDRERCLAAGMDDYITKPVSLEVLAETIARAAGQNPHHEGHSQTVRVLPA